MKYAKRILSLTLVAFMLISVALPMISAADAIGAYPGFEPLYVLDASDPDAGISYANMTGLSIVPSEGYTSFKPANNDPNVWIPTPTCAVKDLGYAVIEYRTTTEGASGQFYAGFDPAPGLSEATCITWEWVGDGEWNRKVIDLTRYRETGAKTFSLLRFDPLQGFGGVTVGSGDSLEVKSIAFFKTEEEANNYSIDAYHQYLKDLADKEDDKLEEEEDAIKNSWQQPAYKEVDASALDNVDGTLSMTPSEDGATITISYELNGETVSYTVPNKNQFTRGPLAGVDDLGRSLYNQYDKAELHSTLPEEYPVQVIPADGGTQVGIFYFLWMGEHGDYGVLDMEKIIAAAGEDKAGSIKTAAWGPLNAMHHFAEPLFGYYYSNDEWVIRKHMELLSNAGVDFLYFDTTNLKSYVHNVKKIMKVCHEMNEQGFDAPQITFYTHTNAAARVREVYDSIYSQNLYPDTWYYVDGKPLMIAPKSANINDFFTIKQDMWPYEEPKENSWPWIDMAWPPRVFEDEDGRMTTVSVAQQSGAGWFAASRLYGDRTNRGRSYDGAFRKKNGVYTLVTGSYRQLQKDPENSYKYGYNIQSQFAQAYLTEADYVLVAGWNEWVAERQHHNFSGLNLAEDAVVFIDTCGVEFSRDIEMTRGYYFDCYYMQLIQNLQVLKGTAPTIVQDGRKTINITGAFDQWDSIPVTYRDVNGDAIERDAMTFGKTPVKDTSNRNDIVASKVSVDKENLYFYIETASAIRKAEDDSTWMNIYLDTDNVVDENGKPNGWYGYDYIINYERVDDFTTKIAKCNTTDGSYGFETVGEASIQVNDNKMMVSVPLSALGVTEYKQMYFTFKIADSDTKITTMEQFYTDGDVAPLGRTNFVFQNYIPGVTVVEPEETETETESAPVETVVDTEETETPVTEAPETDGDTKAPETSATTDKPDGTGCASVVGGVAIMAAAAGAAGVLFRRKERDD